MTQRINKKEVARRLAAKINVDQSTAEQLLDHVLETLYEAFKAGEGVTLTGFGSFYLKPGRSTWTFKFNPSQKLRALLGWSSSYKGPL